jgi:hypothetical protein
VQLLVLRRPHGDKHQGRVLLEVVVLVSYLSL